MTPEEAPLHTLPQGRPALSSPCPCPTCACPRTAPLAPSLPLTASLWLSPSFSMSQALSPFQHPTLYPAAFLERSYLVSSNSSSCEDSPLSSGITPPTQTHRWAPSAGPTVHVTSGPTSCCSSRPTPSPRVYGHLRPGPQKRPPLLAPQCACFPVPFHVCMLQICHFYIYV